jgi:hypothetical protein
MGWKYAMDIFSNRCIPIGNHNSQTIKLAKRSLSLSLCNLATGLVVGASFE